VQNQGYFHEKRRMNSAKISPDPEVIDMIIISAYIKPMVTGVPQACSIPYTSEFPVCTGQESTCQLPGVQ
jgi:hypothetical protein